MRAGAIAVGGILLSIMIWIYTKHTQSFSEYIQFLLRSVPAVAALFAYFSARAALQNLEEQRNRRRDELQPAISAEANEAPFILIWAGDNTPPSFTTISIRRPAENSPHIVLRNWGGGRAINSTVEFKIISPTLPSFDGIGDIWSRPIPSADVKTLGHRVQFNGHFAASGGQTLSTFSFPMLSQANAAVAIIPSGGSNLIVPIPDGILTYLFAWGLAEANEMFPHTSTLGVTVRAQAEFGNTIEVAFQFMTYAEFVPDVDKAPFPLIRRAGEQVFADIGQLRVDLHIRLIA